MHTCSSGRLLMQTCIWSLASRQAPHLPTGCYIVSDLLKWQDVQALGKEAAASLKPIDIAQGIPLTAHLGPLGETQHRSAPVAAR